MPSVMAVSARDVSAGNSARSAFEKACTSSWCSPAQVDGVAARALEELRPAPFLLLSTGAVSEKGASNSGVAASCSRTASAPGSRGCTSPVSSTSAVGAASAASSARSAWSRRASSRKIVFSGFAGTTAIGPAPWSASSRVSPVIGLPSRGEMVAHDTQALIVVAPTAFAASSRRWSMVLSVPLSVCTTRIGGGSWPSSIHRA